MLYWINNNNIKHKHTFQIQIINMPSIKIPIKYVKYDIRMINHEFYLKITMVQKC